MKSRPTPKRPSTVPEVAPASSLMVIMPDGSLRPLSEWPETTKLRHQVLAPKLMPTKVSMERIVEAVKKAKAAKRGQGKRRGRGGR